MSRDAAALDRAIGALRWARAALADAGIAIGQTGLEQRHELAAELARLDAEATELQVRLVAVQVGR